MRTYFLTLAIAGLVAVSACTDAAPPVRVANSTPQPAKPAAARPAAQPADAHQDDGHDAPRITLAEAKKEFDAGNAYIIDVRDVSAYNQEHIAGAVNITKATLAANVSKIPKGKKIIAYCS